MFFPVLSRDFQQCFRLMRPWRAIMHPPEIDAAVHFGKDRFRADLDVQTFKPENITIRVSDDNMVTVEGKHEEKQDDHGYISRHFVRRFVLPRGHDMGQVESKLSSDGVLTITAPRVVEEEQGRTISIEKTGMPYGSLENKEKGDDATTKDEKK